MTASQSLLHGLIDFAMDAIVSVNESKDVIVFNRAAESMFGYSAADIMGQAIGKIIPMHLYEENHHDGMLPESTASAFSQMHDAHLVATGKRSNGAEFPIEVSLSKIEVGSETIYTTIIRDISERVKNEQTLTLAASVFKASREGIIITDENNLIISMNPAATELSGFTLDEVRGKNPRIFKSERHDKQFYESMWKSIHENGFWHGEIWSLCKDGSEQARSLFISVVRNNEGKIVHHIGQFIDISERMRKDEQILRQAYFDPLTDLPNRRLLADRMHQSLASSGRSGRYGALMSLDMDKFKVLNDKHGHSIGDMFLIEVAKRITACMREGDTVARMGGDEFLIVLTELSGDQREASIKAEQIAEKIRHELSRPYKLEKISYRSGVSIGIVLFQGTQCPIEKLLANVDAAMYQAKAKGRNRCCFFDSTIQHLMEQRDEIESALRDALEQHELRLYFQLQVNDAGRSIGAEALLRWMHPMRGLIAPIEFIGIAEETEQIVAIGDWVLETACNQLVDWQNGSPFGQLTMAVNVSARQFTDPEFINKIHALIHKTGVRPSRLKFEITESLVLHEIDDCIRKMNELKDIGIKISIDDFGSGYSSLSYISRLPIDQIKIDQSFVRGISNELSSDAIVRAIISMANSLGLEVIAEGVETYAQRDFLRMRGCNLYQGFLFAKPVPIDQLEQNFYRC
jgi:diguanylate cyclase (GGDEF)-like protein/PAS domain S-box-containing protein